MLSLQMLLIFTWVNLSNDQFKVLGLTLSLSNPTLYLHLQSWLVALWRGGCCNQRDGSSWTSAQLRFRVGRPRSSGGLPPCNKLQDISQFLSLLLVSLNGNNTCIQSECNCRSYGNLCVLTKLSTVKYFSTKWHWLPKCHQNGALEEI